MKEKLLVMGIGNPLLQDDRAGIEVTEKLEAMGAPVDVEVQFTVGFEVLDKVLDHKNVVIVDACLLENEPGTILETTVDDIFSTHALNNSHAVTLGQTLKSGYDIFPDQMPENLSIILIEAKEIKEFSDKCTPEVQKAVDQVVKDLAERAKKYI